MSSVSNLQVHQMPRSRGSEAPQRQSPRGAIQVRTSSSDSDQSHHRSIIERSPKLGDRRSPRSIHSDSPNQKKLGTRIADLESQLEQAQDELKNLKDQLASAEAAKKQAQEELEKKSKNPTEIQDSNDSIIEEVSNEVQVEKATIEPDSELVDMEPEKPSFEDLAMKNEEIDLLKAKLEEKEKALELFGQENEDLKKQIEEARSDLSSGKNKEEETSLRLKQLGEELEESKANAGQLKEAVTTLQGAKEALEAEMKKLRVQTEQWRKAADAAAAILANGVDMNGGISERCGSMDKHFGGVFDTPSGGYNGFVGSPGLADSDDGFGSGKRKGSGRRMFGDLWKKKSSQK